MTSETEYIDQWQQRVQGGFTTPEDYFRHSGTQVLSKINNGGFTVPEGYFEQTKALLTARANKPVVKPLFPHFLKYAAAAILLISGAAAVYLVMPGKTVEHYTEISDDEIINYVAQEHTDDIPLAAFASYDTHSNSKTEEDIVHELDEETLLNEL